LNSSFVNVEANSKNIEIVGSVLNEVKILNGCFLLASHIGINKLETLDNSSAYIENSRIKKVLCKNSSNLILYSSIIDSMECNGDSFIHMKGSEVSEYISVSNNSITFFTPKYINIEKINYNVLNGDLIMSLVNLLRNHTKVSILINRDRIGDRNSLKIMCDGENISYKFEDRKDMEILTFEMTSNMMNLEVSLGPPPTKPTNFFLTSVGQQLISLMIIIVLSGAVILLWR
ncbi:hypothetical protein KEJ17_07985, partial [Candidatus Bathyarchaeota archaeon]|nr:hypothetical protein [Candidatus Bathyarchaeota archaeon]